MACSAMTGDERLVREAVKLGVVNDEVLQLALKKLKNKSTIAWAVETVSDEAHCQQSAEATTQSKWAAWVSEGFQKKRNVSRSSQNEMPENKAFD